MRQLIYFLLSFLILSDPGFGTDKKSGSWLNIPNPCDTESILICLLIIQNINDTERFRMQPYVEVDKIQSYWITNKQQYLLQLGARACKAAGLFWPLYACLSVWLSCLLRWFSLLPHHLHHITRQAVIIPFRIAVEIIAHAHSREMEKISVVDLDPDPGGQKLPSCFVVS